MNPYPRLQPIHFIDIAAQRARLGTAIDDAIARVLAHHQFIMGPEVRALEGELRSFSGARHVISCANGTDALLLVLMAKHIGPSDAVFCPSFTFCATAEVVALVGATPVMIDVEETTFNIDPKSLAEGIKTARSLGLKPKATIPVGLFGQPANFDAINALSKAEGLFVLDDAAQSFGASFKGRLVGTLADATATSFFPAKPLGCYGDGGAIFTDDAELGEVLRSLRLHGQGSDKYDNVRVGMNGRLDTLQAAILIEKLKIFPDEITRRDRIAQRYAAELRGLVTVPELAAETTSVWAQYTIRVPASRRGQIVADLKAQGIPTAIYYDKPLHRQTAYKEYPIAGNGLPISDRLAGEVLSLPMHPYLTDEAQDRVCDAVRRAVAAG